MRITWHPQRSNEHLEILKTGDALTINGVEYDFSVVPEGGLLPPDATDCEWLAGPVTRTGGKLDVPLILPHGPQAPQTTLYPAVIENAADGAVSVPAHSLPPEPEPDPEPDPEAGGEP